MSKRGPRTEAGKVAVAYNSLRHGLRSAAVVIPYAESVEEWERFREGIFASIQPEGSLEECLARRAAELLWRLERVAGAESEAWFAAFIARQQERDEHIQALEQREKEPPAIAEPPPDNQGTPVSTSGVSFYAKAYAKYSANISRDRRNRPALPAHSELDAITRYEAHLNRQLYHALHELQALRDQRQGRAAPLARVQFHGLREV